MRKVQAFVIVATLSAVRILLLVLTAKYADMSGDDAIRWPLIVAVTS